MKKVIFNTLISTLLLCIYISQVNSQQSVLSLSGYWIYGFEQSVLETCEGDTYWMWAPDEFKGKYVMEGYKNPVKVKGYILAPNKIDNMNSALSELKVITIEHTGNPC